MLNKNETLIVVTADHSHGLTITGYPDRGNDILGITGYQERFTNKSFTTLMYATGPGHQKVRLDAAKQTNLTEDAYKQHSTVDLEGMLLRDFLECFSLSLVLLLLSS